MSLVLDASIASAWLFEDEATPRTDDILRRVPAEGATVPAPWRLDVANALRSAVAQGGG
ncbi:MAG: type II toxin-antitoxin system VapC family toxin [Caulobacteraceae bacterium]